MSISTGWVSAPAVCSLGGRPHPAWRPSPAAQAHRSGARGVSHAGSKWLKRAMLGSALTSLRPDPVSRAYYQRGPDQANTRALALAHRRVPIPHAMTRHSALHDPQPADQPPAAAWHTAQGRPRDRSPRCIAIRLHRIAVQLRMAVAWKHPTSVSLTSRRAPPCILLLNAWRRHPAGVFSSSASPPASR